MGGGGGSGLNGALKGKSTGNLSLREKIAYGLVNTNQAKKSGQNLVRGSK